MGKIILCFDGTGNSPANAIDSELTGLGITNVLKLHLLAGGSIDNKANAFEGQRSFYYRGVGTRSNDLINTLRFYFALRGPSVILEECRRDMKRHFKPGDVLYLFGFSRGAAIARMLACELDEKGLELEDGTVVEKPPIAFLGIWDTVSAFGVTNLNKRRLPSCRELNEKGIVAPIIEHALHLVSLDDGRVTFFPTPVGQEENKIRTEVWFPGTHRGVGGGWNERGLSDGVLKYMIRVVSKDLGEERCLQFRDGEDIPESDRFDETSNYKLLPKDVVVKPNYLAWMKDYAGTDKLAATPFIGKFIYVPRPVCLTKDDHPVPDSVVLVHHSVIMRAKSLSEYRPHLGGAKFRIVGDDGSVSEQIYETLAEAI